MKTVADRRRLFGGGAGEIFSSVPRAILHRVLRPPPLL